MSPVHAEEAAPTLDWVRAAFQQFEGTLNGSARGELHALRVRARDTLLRLGFPTTKREEWRYTNIAPLAKRVFMPARTSMEIVPAALDRFDIPAISGHRFVFVNSGFRPELSSAGADLRWTTLRQLFSGTAGELGSIRERIASVARFDEHALLAFNTAFANDGFVLSVPARSEISEPIHLLFLTSPDEGEVFTCPRVFIDAEEGSKCTIIEHHASLRDESYLNCAVTEIIAGDGASVEHTKIQEDSPQAVHFASITARVGRDTKFTSNVYHFGGRLVRHEVSPVLTAPGSETHLNGLSVIGDEQHVDNHTVIDHAAPNCFSREVYKGIYNDESRGVFSGTIVVRHGAQKTNAIQSSNALLLSPSAEINSRPQLQIWADDVKCTHGATVGQLDKEALFYLRARGIPENEARTILIRAFAEDAIGHAADEPVREYLERQMLESLRIG